MFHILLPNAGGRGHANIYIKELMSWCHLNWLPMLHVAMVTKSWLFGPEQAMGRWVMGQWVKWSLFWMGHVGHVDP